MNRYAAQMEMEQNTKMNKDWYPLTNDEVRAYFALHYKYILLQIKKI